MKKYQFLFAHPQSKSCPPSDLITIDYPYKLRIFKNEIFFEEESKNIQISITSSLANSYGYRVWQDSTQYFGLEKIVFEKVKKQLYYIMHAKMIQIPQFLPTLTINRFVTNPYTKKELTEVKGQILEFKTSEIYLTS